MYYQYHIQGWSGSYGPPMTTSCHLMIESEMICADGEVGVVEQPSRANNGHQFGCSAHWKIRFIGRCSNLFWMVYLVSWEPSDFGSNQICDFWNNKYNSMFLMFYVMFHLSSVVMFHLFSVAYFKGFRGCINHKHPVCSYPACRWWRKCVTSARRQR